MEELVSEKHYNLMVKRDELKEELIESSKKLEKIELKIQNLKDEKDDINSKLRWIKVADISDVVVSSLDTYLITLPIDIAIAVYRNNKVKKLKARKSKILKELANLSEEKEELKKSIALMKLDLSKTRQEIREL
jgi:predicted  nucleic acid-binding Zn-ribbon protein